MAHHEATHSTCSTDAIAQKAYELWVEEGQPEGRDQEHWYKAEQVVCGTKKSCCCTNGGSAQKDVASKVAVVATKSKEPEAKKRKATSPAKKASN